MGEAQARAIDTSLLFPMIRDACQNAECKLIDGKRAFVVDESVFLRIMSYFFVSAHDFRFDPRIAAEGYDNVQVQLSALDTNEYYLCVKTEPLLDKLWQDKGPKQNPPK
jgi:hypothetical protein